MTVTATSRPVPPPVPAPARPGGRWRRRWYRVAVPFGLFALLVLVTLVAHAVEEPNLRARETLSPTGTGPDGSSRLAELLTARGVRVQKVTRFTEATAAVETGGDAVVFIPKPDLISSVFAAEAIGHGRHRVVMVAPGDTALWFTPVRDVGSRWATAAVPPDCGLPEAVAAGRAAVLRHRYHVEGAATSCYDGSLVRVWRHGTELIVVGANDPFRNRRIEEHGNATLAVELLAEHDRVIWVESLTFDVEVDFDWEFPELQRPRRAEGERERRSGLAGMFDGYPSAVLAALALAALAAVLLAAARARRLGPPVSEPLPVVVPAAEAVAGRGRLYQRSRGRGVALAALRAAALRRLSPVLGLPPAPPPEPETVVAAVVARTGLPADHVRQTLYGPEPADDGALTGAVAALDNLVATVTATAGDPRNGGEQP